MSSSLPPVTRGAVFTEDRRYRYVLYRHFGPGKTVVFICLNPSKADEVRDDNTVVRCMKFGLGWDAGSVIVLNIFALRSTDPDKLYSTKDPVGPLNDTWIRKSVAGADIIVAAWGNHGDHPRRGAAVRKLLREERVKVYCFDTTNCGEPRHPLYLRRDEPLRHYIGAGMPLEEAKL